ncbi:hypothetical protein J4414_01300 [Candidatus Woesearchaeota archaeon]|nr:hypothetical protein [Candidatus Woesearchaeota archaeon]
MADMTKNLFKLFVGLLVMLMGIWLIFTWSGDVGYLIKILFKGSIGIFVTLVGLGIVLLSSSALKG